MQLPQEFVDDTRALMGEELYAIFEKGMAQEPPTSVRINPNKLKNPEEVIERMTHGDKNRRIPWSSHGVYLSERPNFTFDPLMHAGLYYVQEASSMYIGHVLRQFVHEPVMMLDLCASPGGKTTAAGSVLPEGSLLFSNEPMKIRASVLAENVQKFGHPDVIVTNNYAIDYQRSGLQFDVILTDVPCSGEGMFRKDAGAISEWSREHVAECSMLQRSIIEDIWSCLKPGGLLIYSTCTYNAHENEENVAWIMDTFGAEPLCPAGLPEWGITGALTGNSPVSRFIPGKTKGEGLFVAVLRKPVHEQEEGVDRRIRKATKNKNKGKGKTGTDRHGKGEQLQAWVRGDMVVLPSHDGWTAIPRVWEDVYRHATEQLHVIHAGVSLGTEKGKDVIPSPALALSTALDETKFPTVEVSYEEAIAYLRKEALVLPEGTAKGIILLKYHGAALGFVKNIGNRANNLYPQEWKIKSTYLPEQIPDVIGV